MSRFIYKARTIDSSRSHNDGDKILGMGARP